ncbi:MAG: hypothetical protein ABJA81_11785 [Nocardioidaceae bacterium]
MDVQGVTLRPGVGTPSLSYFRELSGSTLDVYHLNCQPAGTLTCAAVVDGGEESGSGSFRVEFLGQPDRLLEQDTYQLRAADGTTFPLLLVQAGWDDLVPRYEAGVTSDVS